MHGRIIAIGDIHGCYHTMVALMKKLDVDFTTDKLIFLGDYLDRGNFPLKTVLALKDIHSHHSDNIICLKGNHEDMCCRYYKNGDPMWSWNGYEDSFEQIEAYEDKDGLLRWMNSLPLRYETEHYCFCHSGNWSTRKDPVHSAIECLWDRNWLRYGLSNNCNREKPVIFGHTPHLRPAYYGENICIDTGACYLSEGCGHLTAAVLTDGEPVSFVSVETLKQDVSCNSVF